MSLIDWSDKFSVNVREIDEQHRKLINLINTLHGAMKAGKSVGVIAEVLQELAEYTDYHFSTEGGYMTMHGYPAYHQHKAKHGKFAENR